MLRKPLSEPLFVLGVLFILIVFFLPGGLAGIGGARAPDAACGCLEQRVGREAEAGRVSATFADNDGVRIAYESSAKGRRSC